MYIDSTLPIEQSIAQFFLVYECQISIDGRTFMIHVDSEREFVRLCQMYDYALEWRGLYHNYAISLGDRLLVLPLREAVIA
ncbi:hypothetical protein H6F89_28465 [Cyanobacteria bacterium FACHB-63]|nr:hypothetical protein [Cyanobacteria bacterium FACHB-63]